MHFVSDRLKGNTSNRRVIRRCQPPLPFTILLMIHDAAEPHTKLSAAFLDANRVPEILEGI